jgi:hypothetical protein
MLNQTDMVQNPTLQGGQTLLWLTGLAPEPLPPDPGTAIENFLIHGHANYIPKGATQILNAFDHPAASTMMVSVKLPENCTWISFCYPPYTLACHRSLPCHIFGCLTAYCFIPSHRSQITQWQSCSHMYSGLFVMSWTAQETRAELASWIPALSIPSPILTPTAAATHAPDTTTPPATWWH